MRKLLKGGTVVSDKTCFKADILIENGIIARLADNIKAEEDMELIDVSGRLLFPGFVDAHTHFDLHVSSTVTADDFRSGTKAAVCGGTTTIIDYATQYEGESLHEAVENWHKKADNISSCDYGFHLAISDWNEDIEKELESIVSEGISTFKLYMTYDGMYLDDRRIYEIINKLHELKAFAGVHCENKYLIEALVHQMKSEGRLGTDTHPLTRPDTVEAEAINRLLNIAKLADSEVMVVHLTSQPGLEEIRRAREAGQRVYAETCPQYLLLDDSVYSLPDFEGAKYVIAPPIRKKNDSKVLWEALKNGEIDTIATDHCSFNMEQKRAGINDFTKIPNGMPGVESRAALLIEEAVTNHGFSYEKLCALLSTNAAKLYGIYPKKGVIAEGSDADIVVWNSETEWTMSADNQISNAGYHPFEGRRVKGKAELVFLRGELAARDGKPVSECRGEYIRRGLPCL